ncbi:predicted protein [Aspergillus nidulans FGSC A4]|uniref:Uncharacterized protein n=1 Tax=Emericella nidulans (strain FGSC A4 / ATCC 38163 / CBS 112.46 / NRRL 194 / M139) TaxID=227321 RepID=Q5BEY0_EMENI|nr:hypothetical protein [Aspergillus nidulans FGSC A4]EAA65929.1 predicted protein [Aspergillus nidulans FGSC A4]CBF88562.1 TPA: conserved hypothetical protein [Aspergillus nidulans FGSC A4]|eukprot:XP_658504.1 predicted protein [Aspergillus nidulans FGSC A4]
MPYDFPPPQPLYPHVPFAADRGSEGPFRRPVHHGYQEFQTRLFLDEYRFPGSQQTYQPPHLEAGIQTPLAHPWEGENAYELEGPPVAQNIQLRGDAPEFVPGWKPSVTEESESKPKEPCWLIPYQCLCLFYLRTVYIKQNLALESIQTQTEAQAPQLRSTVWVLILPSKHH